MLREFLLLAVLSFWNCLSSGVRDEKSDEAQGLLTTAARELLTQKGGEMAVKPHIETSPTVIPADLKTPAPVAQPPTEELPFPIELRDYAESEREALRLEVVKQICKNKHLKGVVRCLEDPRGE